jgi:hypothetical protein
LLIELTAFDAESDDWNELHTLCEPHLAEARALREKFSGLEALRAERQAAIKVRRAEEAACARTEAEAAAQREREAAEHKAALAAMTPHLQTVEAFKAEFAARAEQMHGNKDRPNTAFHDKARALAKTALESTDWTPDEKRAAAEAIAEWLPKVVAVDMKDERKKLKLAVLRGET